MIQIQITGATEVAAKFDTFPQAMRDKIFMKFGILAVKLQSHIKNDKLSGQVLNIKTGDLKNSIQQEVTQDASSVTAEVFSAGNIPYAAIHEYGGVIHHPGGTPYFFDEFMGKAVFVSIATAITEHLHVQVTKAHDIPMPMRSYMRTGLADMRQEILETMQGIAAEAFQ